MTNLIPPESKKQLVRLYFVRLVSAWSLLWSVALLVGALLLYPTYLLITGTSDAYAQTAQSVNARTAEYDLMVGELNRSNEEAKSIIKATDAPQFSSLLADIWNANGQGVSINSVDLSAENRVVAPYVLQGVATDRQSLALFRNRLEALPYVTEINLPIENLAGNQDIDFVISVTVNTKAL